MTLILYTTSEKKSPGYLLLLFTYNHSRAEKKRGVCASNEKGIIRYFCGWQTG
jgi:hypothetical protein